MGKHSHVDCFYLCQSYARIPKHLIRDNANLLILFKQDGTTWSTCTMIMWIPTCHTRICELCRNGWQQKYGFQMIDRTVHLLTDDIEKDLTSSRCRGAVSHYRYTPTLKERQHGWEQKYTRAWEGWVRETEKTVESIHKKTLRFEDWQNRRR